MQGSEEEGAVNGDNEIERDGMTGGFFWCEMGIVAIGGMGERWRSASFG